MPLFESAMAPLGRWAGDYARTGMWIWMRVVNLESRVRSPLRDEMAMMSAGLWSGQLGQIKRGCRLVPDVAPKVTY